MGLKAILLICIQLIILANFCCGQIRFPPRRLPLRTLPTPPPVDVTNFVNCTQYSTLKDYWIQYTYNGKQSDYCYLYPSYDTHTASWHVANEFCRRKNASLLSIHDYKTNYILSHPLRLRTGYGEIYWIGLSSLNGKRGIYKWSDRSPVEITNYATTTSVGDPIPGNVKDQGRCVSMRVMAQNNPYKNNYKNAGQWFKEDCNLNHRYICKRNVNPPLPLPTPPSGGCPTGWYNANNKCIKYFPQQLTFQQAKDKCFTYSNGQSTGELLTIHSQLEQDFVTSITAGTKTPYIGLTREYATTAWKWSDESQFTYSNFGLPQTTTQFNKAKYCAVLVTNTTQPGAWLAVYCTDLHPFICEVNRDPSVHDGKNLLSQKCNITGFGNFVQYSSSCYKLIDDPATKLTFLDAENHCKSLGTGAHLTSIVNPYEQAFLKYYITQTNRTNMYLIGLQSKAESETNDTQLFEWSDGWPVYYSNWMIREPVLTRTPQDQCVVITNIKFTYNSWKTVSCSTPYSYICKVTKSHVSKIDGPTNGVCPKLIGIHDRSLDWVNLHKGLQYCYWFSTERKGIPGSTGLQSWSDASFHCRRRSGTLVSIHSNRDALIISTRLKKSFYYKDTWIGLSKDPQGDLVWEDNSPLSFSNWAPGERYKNASDLNDDSGNVCVEMSWDMTWKQVACNGERNYFVCQTKKLFANQSSPSTSRPGKTAGIVIGVLLGVGAFVFIGIYVVRRSNLKVPQMPSFENPLNRSQRGTATGGTAIKPQEFHNNNPTSSDLTNSNNENPFQHKSFE